MGRIWNVFVFFILAINVLGYEETKLEDVIGEYEFRTFKNIFVNTTRQVIDAVNKLENGIAHESSISALEASVQGMQRAMEGLKAEASAVRDSVDNGDDGIKVQFKMLQDKVVQEMDQIKTSMDNINRHLEEQDGTLQTLSLSVNAGDCFDLYKCGLNASGTYYLSRYGRNILCDMEDDDDAGWLVIQRRIKTPQQVDFNRDWMEYKTGFGNQESEFWIGNDFLHVLTNQRNYRMRINIEDYEKGPYWAEYSSFRVGKESDGYPLDIGDFTGNATDAFTYHHGNKFTSTDRDNDQYDEGNCATLFSGAWWYDRCYDAHLNGIYPAVPDRQNASFITWWAYEDDKKVPLVLTHVTIKIKPTQH